MPVTKVQKPIFTVHITGQPPENSALFLVHAGSFCQRSTHAESSPNVLRSIHEYSFAKGIIIHQSADIPAFIICQQERASQTKAWTQLRAALLCKFRFITFEATASISDFLLLLMPPAPFRIIKTGYAEESPQLFFNVRNDTRDPSRRGTITLKISPGNLPSASTEYICSQRQPLPPSQFRCHHSLSA